MGISELLVQLPIGFLQLLHLPLQLLPSLLSSLQLHSSFLTDPAALLLRLLAGIMQSACRRCLEVCQGFSINPAFLMPRHKPTLSNMKCTTTLLACWCTACNLLMARHKAMFSNMRWATTLQACWCTACRLRLIAAVRSVRSSAFTLLCRARHALCMHTLCALQQRWADILKR